MTFTNTMTFGHLSPPSERKNKKPTIYEALCEKLGREATHTETVAEVKRILNESVCERAEQGKLRHQRKR